jgi:hypothetical protein
MKCRVVGSLKGVKDLIDLTERWAYLQNVIRVRFRRNDPGTFLKLSGANL